MLNAKRTTKILLWGITAGWLLLAIFLSSQTGEETGSFSLAIARFIGAVFGVPESGIGSLHIGLRTAAHVIVFFVLTVLCCFAAVVTFRTKRSIFISGMICLVVAVIDEMRKAGIPGRHATLSEAGLNAAGCLAGAALVFLIWSIWRKRQKP